MLKEQVRAAARGPALSALIFLIFRIILSQIVYDLLDHHLLQINVKAQVADESEELQLIAVLPFGNIGKGRH